MTPAESGQIEINELRALCLSYNFVNVEQVNTFFNYILPYVSDPLTYKRYLISAVHDISNGNVAVSCLYNSGYDNYLYSGKGGTSPNINRGLSQENSSNINRMACKHITSIFIRNTDSYFGYSDTAVSSKSTRNNKKYPFTFTNSYKGSNCYFPSGFDVEYENYKIYVSNNILQGSDNWSASPNLYVSQVQKLPNITEDIVHYGSTASKTFLPKKYKGEKSRFLKITDEAYSRINFFMDDGDSITSEAFGENNEMQIPDEVFAKAGLVYGAVLDNSGNYVKKKLLYFKVEDLPGTATTLSLTTSGDSKTFRINDAKEIQFLWKLSNTSTRPKIVIDSSTSFRALEVWSDTNPSARYLMTGSNNTFTIPTISYLGTDGTFHGLLHFGDGTNQDTIVTEFIWNFI